MKLAWNRKYTTIALYAFIVLVAASLLFLAILNFPALKKFVSFVVGAIKPILYGLVIAYLVNPMMCFFETRVFRFKKQTKGTDRARRGLSLTLSLLIVLAVLGLFFGFFFTRVSESYELLVSKMGGYLQSLGEYFDTHSPAWAEQFRSIKQVLGLEDTSIFENLSTYLSDALINVSPTVISFLTSTVKELLNVLVGLILAVYLLCFKERTLAQFKKFCTAVMREDHRDELYRVARITDENIGGFIRGKLLDSLIVGVLTYFVLMIVKMPYYPVIALIIGVTNFIPFFGPFIGAIPSAFIVLIAEPKMTIWFLLIILIIQQLDGNVIGNLCLSGSLRLSSLWVSIAIIVMGGLFGFWGMLIGVPIFAVIYTLVTERVNASLAKKGLPTDTVVYAPEGSYSPSTTPRKRRPSSLVKPKEKNKRKK